MKEHALVPLLTQIASPIAESLDIVIWGIRVVRGRSTIIQCFIDKTDGATVEDCSNFSRHLSDRLDGIESQDSLYSNLGSLEEYTLEVSTPGLERVFFSLEQLHNYVGETVSLLLNQPISKLAGKRKIEGILNQIENDVVCINVSGIDELYRCPWNIIERIHLMYFNKAAQ